MILFEKLNNIFYRNISNNSLKELPNELFKLTNLNNM